MGAALFPRLAKEGKRREDQCLRSGVMPQDQEEAGRHWDFRGSQPITPILWGITFFEVFFFTVTSGARCLSRNLFLFFFKKLQSAHLYSPKMHRGQAKAEMKRNILMA